MSEASERSADTSPDPVPETVPDPDAWATACAEDLAAEQARRRSEYGPQPGSGAQEFRRLLDAFADKVSGGRGPVASSAAVAGAVATNAAQQFARQAVQQVKAVVEPVLERNPEVFDHLAAAGAEIVAAYRAAVERQEASWTKGDEPPSSPERIDLE
ncbi:MAG: DUF5304 domain-containing protein [Kitasatospora sp.]|jgi:hypothetical protein|nr:DUF5304 domain-containing protein [Kitasatospora sp.]